MTYSLVSPQKSSTVPHFGQWTVSTWDEYIFYRDTLEEQRIKLYYYQDQLLIQMGKEGINHTSINDLFTMILFIWFSHYPEIKMNTFGGVLLEKKETRSASPDLVVYLGEDYPKWKPGESRYVNLDKWRVPDLVGEISDTTLSSDLDEKKHLYAELGIPEYWVIDVQAKRVFAFQLQANGNYQESEISLVLKGLPIDLLMQTMQRLEQETNSSAASWFSQEVSRLKRSDHD